MYNTFPDRKREFISVPVTESTNNDLKNIIKQSDAPVFSAVTAERQLSGRGRLGRSFLSPSGGLYFSLAYPLTGDEKNIPFLTLLAGLAVSDAINELTGAATLIKWPNDIYLGGRKLGGILTELISCRGLTAVVGIGINLSEKNFPGELQDIATSFSHEGITAPDKAALMNSITEKLDRLVYDDGCLYNVKDSLHQKLRERSFSIGKAVRYNAGNEEIKGIVTDIKNTGAAEITLPDGTKREIFCGEII